MTSSQRGHPSVREPRIRWGQHWSGRATVLLAALLLVSACGSRDDSSAMAVDVPEPDMTDMEQQVEARLRETRAAVLADPQSSEAWGRFGMVTHAHELWDEATVAYRRAQELDPEDERWPYFLGDVLSVAGTELAAAEQAFRRSLELHPDYAPAHMRLGNVLVAANQSEKAAIEFARALELRPGFQQAQVPLAQIRLSEGELEEAERLLEAVLASAPRHGQALSTLGQVYMRQGRRDEAREIAGRARDAASYNLYEDPLMSKVVAEGVSSIQLWERAKSFLENGNYEQAVLGLRQVVKLRPDSADVHQQLAVAYGNLGEVDRSRRHLERVIVLEPDLESARIQLALLLIQQQQPADAIPHLEHAMGLMPDDLDAGWLLGKARVMAGDPRGAVRSFEQTAEKGAQVPTWARNEWGRALVESGEIEAGQEHFRTALEADPENAQALFYLGLIFEGLGRVDEAVEHYCRSMRSEPSPPVAARLRQLERSCA